MCHKVFIGRSFPNGTHFFFIKGMFRNEGDKILWIQQDRSWLAWSEPRYTLHILHIHAQIRTNTFTHIHIYMGEDIYIYTYMFCVIVGIQYRQI